MAEADPYLSAADMPNYYANAMLVDQTAPIVEIYRRLTSTRTYDPRFLPSYVDTVDKDGNVVVSAEDKFSKAIPKVYSAISSAVPSNIESDYSLRFLILAGGSLLWAHIKNWSTLYERGDLDPYTNPYYTDNPTSSMGADGDGSPNPMTPLPTTGNCYCPESQYLMPYEIGTYTDKDGTKHTGSQIVNPKNGSRSGDQVGALVRNDCLSKHKSQNRSAAWQRLISRTGWDAVAGYYTEDYHADCVDTCVVSGRVTEFLGTDGPFYGEVKPIKMLICPKRGRSYETTRNVPTKVMYKLKYRVKDAEIKCIKCDWTVGWYGISAFYVVVFHNWGTIVSSYSYGRTVRRTGKTRDGYDETVDISLPYEIEVGYDDNGCPYIVSQGFSGPIKGLNSGSIDFLPDTGFEFRLVPESEIPSDWFDDDDDEDDEGESRISLSSELYPSVSASSLQRFRDSQGR